MRQRRPASLRSSLPTAAALSSALMATLALAPNVDAGTPPVASARIAESDGGADASRSARFAAYQVEEDEIKKPETSALVKFTVDPQFVRATIDGANLPLPLDTAGVWVLAGMHTFEFFTACEGTRKIEMSVRAGEHPTQRVQFEVLDQPPLGGVPMPVEVHGGGCCGTSHSALQSMRGSLLAVAGLALAMSRRRKRE